MEMERNGRAVITSTKKQSRYTHINTAQHVVMATVSTTIVKKKNNQEDEMGGAFIMMGKCEIYKTF